MPRSKRFLSLIVYPSIVRRLSMSLLPPNLSDCKANDVFFGGISFNPIYRASLPLSFNKMGVAVPSKPDMRNSRKHQVGLSCLYGALHCNQVKNNTFRRPDLHLAPTYEPIHELE